MDVLATPENALALARTAVLLVLGHQLARPAHGRAVLALALYAAALVAVFLGARGLAPGGAVAAPPAARHVGLLLLVAGLVVAVVGARRRDRARAGAAARRDGAGNAAPHTARAEGAVAVPAGTRWMLHGGLALVLASALLREPSAAAGALTLLAIAAQAWAASR
jgi:hypothetical protein